MIIIKHKAGQIREVVRDEKVLSELKSRFVSLAMLELAKQYPDELLVWCDIDISDSVQLDKIPGLFVTGRELLSYSQTTYLPDALAYIEDTPFVSTSTDVRYPTWMMSSLVGAVYCKVFTAFIGFSKETNLDYFLNSFAKRAMPLGIQCYSEPAMLKDPGGAVNQIEANKTVLFRFVKEHYKKHWAIILLIAFWVFERRLPLFPFLKSQFNSQLPLEMTRSIPVKKSTEEDKSSIDVLIPTLGRAKYLKLVLEDLSLQDHLPSRVIIIEQNHDERGTSELDYLEDSWPFEIVHRLIHPPGACRARNIGLTEVTSDWVFMADDDIRIPADFLSSALRFMKDYGINATTFSCLQEGESDIVDQVVQWNAFGSGCSIVASAIATTTFYDERMEMGYGEDKEYGMQLRRKGVDILYNPNIKLLHLKAPSGGFRKESKKPWEIGDVVPKPSPTITYFKMKHATIQQLKGYKLRLFLKFYREQKSKNFFSYRKWFTKAWRSSVSWAKKLGTAT